MNGILKGVASECLVIDSEDDQFNGVESVPDL